MSALLNLQTIIIMLAAIASFTAILAFTLPYLQTDQRDARLKAVTKHREELSEQQRARFQDKSTRGLRPKQVSLMKRVVDMLRLQNFVDSERVRNRLVQAGHRRPAARVVFTFAHVAAPLIVVIFAVMFLLGPGGANMALATKIMIGFGAGLIGFLVPTVIVSNMIQKRQQLLIKAFPDALDLLVICVESGSSLEGAFTRVAEEMSDSAPELAEEFGLTTAELAFLANRRDALERFATRTGLAATKSLSTALIQAEKYGTPLGVSLRVLAQESRDARMSAAEKKAGSLPAKLTVPMITFFLPVLFIVLLGPAVIQTLAKFSG